MRTLITNGTIVTADGSYAADILIDGETIAQIGRDLAGAGVTADETIDATGRYVIPGGIDVHTHMELPFGGTFAKDTFETGTRAAAFGGTTSIVDFAVQGKGQSLREGLDAWHAKAEGNAVTDYGFHMIMSDVNDATLAEMDGLVAEGVPDFKLFTAYPGVFYSDDGAIFRAMQQTAKNGGLIMMHAENGMAIDVVAAQTVEAGTTDPIGHGLARKPIFEGEATNRVIRLAEAAGAPVYIVHLSAREALARPCATRAIAAAGSSPRRARSTSSSRSTTSATGSRAPSSSARRRSGPRTTGTSCGPGSSRTTCSSSRPTTARSTSTARRSSGGATSARSPTACRASRTGSTCSTTAASSAGRITRSAGSRSSRPRRPSCSGCTRRRARSRSARRRPRHLRPGAQAHDLGGDPPHGRRLLVLRGPGRPGRREVVLSRGSVVVRDGEFTGRKGAGRFIKRAPADYARIT